MSVEEYVIAYLSYRLNVPVSGNVPSPMPQTFVTVEKTGSREKDYIYTGTLAVQSWAESTAAACALNEEVKAAMRDMNAEDAVSACDLNSDYNYMDTTRKRPRYQAVFDVVFL